MKGVRTVLLVGLLALSGCMSLVFAKSDFEQLPAGTYKLDLTHASIVWKVSHLGLSDYVARFADFDASIDYKPDDISASKVVASINPMSIQTAYPNAQEKDFDKTLATEKGWFNATTFASIDFVSTRIEMTSESTASMTGDLTFLGVTKPVTLEVVFNGAMLKQPFSGKPTMGFSATTTVDRTEWGMSKYAPNIGAEVEVLIEGEFAKLDE
ncbi:polyisoprenoid-binding protein [Alteromonas sediminis]|uniref:Polyisoprenoid-binding protein n=1 Tax=Alteromonas sediminis TaxID=2259342 RepID=A0A3N5Y0D7_9ALTE|nr:YceI family protein [Alteromonas sediminis]RPJ65936.1 polyisoprenoid-binding protein [Alteromonas sediminis]